MPAVHEGLVSVLVPTFNGERFLEETLRSIVDQTHERLEILVCDDGSTDETVAIARRFAGGGSPRPPPPRGPAPRPGRQLRALLELARGPYVKFLMQDDLLVPHAIERLLGARGGRETTSCWPPADGCGSTRWASCCPTGPRSVPPFHADTVR